MRFPLPDVGMPTSTMEACWPVGSIYLSTLATNPVNLFGFGTWAAIAAGRVLVGQDVGQAEFDVLGETGGAKDVTLTAAHLPAHNHPVTDPGHTHTLPVGATDDTAAPFDRADAGTNAAGANATTATGSATTGITTGNTGGGTAHPNLPPYLVVKIWSRVA